MSGDGDVGNGLARRAARRLLVGLAGSVLTLVVGLADHTMWERELSSSVLYLLPIALAAWFGGRVPGLVVAALAAVVWYRVDQSRFTYLNPAAPWWNGSVRLLFFTLSALFLSSVRRTLRLESRLAGTDMLTGAANGRRFFDELAREMQRCERTGRPYTVALFDLDHFKRVNDQGGHAEGDRLLRELVEAVRSRVRSVDVLARLGGDEFAILLPETDRDGAVGCLEKVRSAVRERMASRGWPVTCSIGGVTAARTVDSARLLRQADRLMYEVKRAGRDGLRVEAFEARDPVGTSSAAISSDTGPRPS